MSLTEKQGENHIPEILAPAGTFEALEAAVNAGADAVYLGGDLFGARAFAGNFHEDDLIAAIRYCHLFDVKVYLTVNTLFKQEELDQLPAFLQPYYEAGIDAVLVQDLGAAKRLRQQFPDLPLHASTQMSISSRFGAAFLKTLGFCRIVPSRELSLEELRSIKDAVGIEVETFVHGALCFAYSGKCLFSSFLGGRSGNRGRCAQPCRQCYEVSGTQEKTEYALSLKDLCTLSLLPELIEAGIDSFKIEGRMKNPAYVYAAARAYVTARDLYRKLRMEAGTGFAGWTDEAKHEYAATTDTLQKQLRDIYNRGGFCSGYYHTRNGMEMAAADRPNHDGLPVGKIQKVTGPTLSIRLSESVHPGDVLEVRGDAARQRQNGKPAVPCIAELTCNTDGLPGAVISLKGKNLKQICPGMAVYRTRNQTLLTTLETAYRKERTVPVNAFVRAVEGQPLQICLEEIAPDPARVEVNGLPVEAAGSRPVTEEQLLSKLKKSSGSHLSLEAQLDVGENVFVSMSEFNRLRHEAAEQFRQTKAARYERKKTAQSTGWNRTSM